MIVSVQVGASPTVRLLVEGKSQDEQNIISQNTEYVIQRFLSNVYPSNEDVLKLCAQIAEIFEPSCIASHYVADGVLMIFLDAVPEEIRSKFLYTPHSLQAH